MLLTRAIAVSAQATSQPLDIAMRLSVIVPLAPDELAWPALIAQLAALPFGSEVILVHTCTHVLQRPQPWPHELGFRSVSTRTGRALQQNAGARQARGRWLWFLHADSRLQATTLAALNRFLDTDSDSMGYFDLEFADDGPRLTRLNAWGANLRSRWLGMPFGDQGLLLPAARFHSLGGFDEQTPHGEDHLLVWAARHAGLRLQRIAAPIRTSARKYARQGWLRTTLRHWWLTAAQAWPAWRATRRGGS